MKRMARNKAVTEQQQQHKAISVPTLSSTNFDTHTHSLRVLHDVSNRQKNSVLSL
jgi:hypothetical protein